MVVSLSALSSAGSRHGTSPRNRSKQRIPPENKMRKKKANGSHSVLAQRRAFGSTALACGVAFRRLSKPLFFQSGEQNGLLYYSAPICSSLMPKGDLARFHALSNTWKWTSFAIGITTCDAPCLSPMLSALLCAILASGCSRSWLIAAEVWR